MTLVETGIGLQNAEVALQYVIGEHNPDFVLSIGFGGALYMGAEIGDLIWPSKVLLVGDGIAETIELPGLKGTANRISSDLAMCEGSILTLACRMRKSGIKESLYRGLLFPVCDMETFPLAKLAVERGLNFFAVRSVTDRAGEEIPSALYDVANESGHYRLSRAISILLRNPGLAAWSLRLGINSRTASKSLWLAVRSLAETL